MKLFLKYCVSDQTNGVSAIGALFIYLLLIMEIATAKYEKIISYTYLGLNHFKADLYFIYILRFFIFFIQKRTNYR